MALGVGWAARLSCNSKRESVWKNYQAGEVSPPFPQNPEESAPRSGLSKRRLSCWAWRIQEILIIWVG